MPKRKVGSVVTFKNGAKAKVLPSGRMRIFKGPTKKSGKRTTKGGSVSVGGGYSRKRTTKGGSVNVGGGYSRKRTTKAGSVNVGGSVSIGGGVRRRRKKKGGGLARKLIGSTGYGKALLSAGNMASGMYNDIKRGNYF